MPGGEHALKLSAEGTCCLCWCGSWVCATSCEHQGAGGTISPTKATGKAHRAWRVVDAEAQVSNWQQLKIWPISEPKLILTWVEQLVLLRVLRDTAAGYSGNRRKELSILWAPLPQQGHPAVSASSYTLVGLI